MHDFELDGEVAKYAPCHPRQWRDEDAISHDRTLLAFTSGHERVLIYHIEPQQLCQVLDGAGHLRPTPAYAIGCSITGQGSRSGINNQLVFWESDEQGRLLDQEEPIDASAFATQTIDAILPDLANRHNDSTQSGMLAPEGLLCVVVDVINAKEIHRLFGHTDAIVWSAISPNNAHIASVAWGGTLRMYSVVTGKLEWTTSGGGQAWTGAFSADSRHIVWSTVNGHTVIVHDVLDGRSRFTFPKTFRDWCRNVAWHPDGKQIALCAGKHGYVWCPFDGEQGQIMQHYQMEDDKNWRSTASVEDIDWSHNGRSLHLYFYEGTNLVYDTQNNTKELFMRPRGVDSAWTDSGFYGYIKVTGFQDGYISVDGDDKVRNWPAGTSTPKS
ncbi:WD40 repeat-like protein [Didymella exigua CBS 183.55]|uniref:WD40 repeat-like protein n=1 Tax=Didymella exigua CBS 183.55 TaxID=1150837 RepID=A0A6A5RCZ2_9PLEO|nr:WD40 repeat-like protein [Didymella exigua CBS 183.55]KAF1926111.1 WD40 repeat-like protein [Didymella exigua CBS 183.55]